ncbi:MAG: response regulator transcription factor [candidate division NC10 bacterium]|nr:response regulator transcription factor [candidate division NC10 bacterium]
MTTIVVPASRRDLFIIVHIFRDVSRLKEMERFVQQLLSNVARLSWPHEVEPLPDPPSLDTLLDHSQELTDREVEVLRFLASGIPTKAIAEQLCISPSTVKNHTQNILAKLKVHSRLEAVALAFRYGLI